MYKFIPLLSLLLISSAAYAELPCTTHVPGPSVGLEEPLFNEISGMTLGHANEDIYWAHTDSGGKAEVYALNRSGVKTHTITIRGAKNVDWEDIAVGPCPTTLAESCIYIADLGDNLSRRTNKKILVVPELVLSDNCFEPSVDVLRTIEIKFPDAPDLEKRFANPDCESLMVDPRDGAIYIISKQSEGGPQTLYRIDVSQKDDTFIGTPVPLADYLFTSVTGAFKPLFNAVTGADFFRDGSRFLVRTYARIYEYDTTNQSVADAFLAPSLYVISNELQGESITYTPDGKNYLATSEKFKETTPTAIMHEYYCNTLPPSINSQREFSNTETLPPQEL